MIKKTLIMILCATLLTGCAATSAQQEAAKKNKPALAPLEVYNKNGTYGYSILRHCDGTTLLYVRDDYRAGMAVIPNSPVCGGK